MPETLRVERVDGAGDDGDGGVVLVTLDRPDRFNAMTRTMFAEIVAVTDDLRDDPSVRAVVLTGAGRAFCGGYDLAGAAEFADLVPADALALQDAGVRALRAVHDLPQPVIAAVAGPAVGGGFSLALAADMRVADPTARFQAVFVRIGLSGADLGTSWLLPRVVGRGIAAELLYTGRAVGADEAGRIGLVNRSAPDGEVVATACALAGEVATHSTTAVRLTKRALDASAESSFATALETEARAQALLFGDPAVHAAVHRVATRADRSAPQ